MNHASLLTRLPLRGGCAPLSRSAQGARRKGNVGVRTVIATAAVLAVAPLPAPGHAQDRCAGGSTQLPINECAGAKLTEADGAMTALYRALMDQISPKAKAGLAGLWENWKDPATSEWVRTFAVVTTNANELVAEIHDRMPVILRPEDYERWLGPEADPRDMLQPFPPELMTVWPVSTRVNTPRNDDPDLLVPFVQASADAPPDGNSA
jgi:hypothetical protein